MMSTTILGLILLFLLLLLGSQTEGFTELFGFSGNSKGTEPVLDDNLEDLSGYKEAQLDLTPDESETIIRGVNASIAERTGLCTYIIENLKMTKYVHETNKDTFYRCVFMVMKKGGFAFGFAVAADVELKPALKIRALNTQPMGPQAGSGVASFVDNGAGHEFYDYKMIKENGAVTLSGLDAAKNKFA